MARRSLGEKSGATNATRCRLLGRSRNAGDAELGKAWGEPAPPAAWSPSLHMPTTDNSGPAMPRTLPRVTGLSRGNDDLIGSTCLTSTTEAAALPQLARRSPWATWHYIRRGAWRELSDTANAALPTPLRRAQALGKFKGEISRLGRGARPSTALKFVGNDICLGRRLKLGWLVLRSGSTPRTSTSLARLQTTPSA